jgi:AraC family transcriptional regulator
MTPGSSTRRQGSREQLRADRRLGCVPHHSAPNLSAEERAVSSELGLLHTNGILRQPWVMPERTSAGLGWDRHYLSVQREQPYRESFAAARTHLVILHLDGPVTVRRGEGDLSRARTVPAGGLFIHPAGRDLTVELGGPLSTVHLYLSDDVLQDAVAGGKQVELAEEIGTSDRLLEQLVLSMDETLRRWEPTARTYVDQLGSMVAAQLVRRHGVGRVPTEDRPAGGFGDCKFSAVRSVMEERLAEPVALAELAAIAGLSVSQFSRQFKARTGLAPHRYLLGLRVDKACRLLRTERAPIADIAVRCGFSHQEHLTRVLRAHLGTTPGAVRRGT